MFGLGMQELIIIGIVAVMLFGKRLPEVARSLGKSYNEFRRGLGDIQSEFTAAADTYRSSSNRSASQSTFSELDDVDEATAPKFEPPPAEPTAPKFEPPPAEPTQQT